MSRATAALEHAVAEVIGNRAAPAPAASARQRVMLDRAFARVLRLIAPRIRHFICRYGLAGYWEDAEQCCAIAVHRAIEAYDPAKASFTTLVNWQIRGELQSLRFRLMTDQRSSARKVNASTVALHQVIISADGDESTIISADGDESTFEMTLLDEGALKATEAAASDYLARAATQALVDEFIAKDRIAALARLRGQQSRVQRAASRSKEQSSTGAPPIVEATELERLEQKLAQDREVLLSRIFGHPEQQEELTDPSFTNERIRHMGRRASTAMAALVLSNPRFAVMADYAGSTKQRRAA